MLIDTNKKVNFFFLNHSITHHLGMSFPLNYHIQWDYPILLANSFHYIKNRNRICSVSPSVIHFAITRLRGGGGRESLETKGNPIHSS